MITGIMITDGGSHPADKWAAQSASQICSLIQVDQHSISEEARAARRVLPRFELDLADALEPHHGAFQLAERDLLAEDHARLSHPYVGHHELDEQLAAVARVAAKTPFAGHFAKPETQKAVRDILQSHFATVQHIERSWHTDRELSKGTSNEHVVMFAARRSPPTAA